MVNISRQAREDLRFDRIKTGNEKRWKLQEAYRKKSLAAKEWTVKGVITRLYGQGAQKLFESFPKYRDAAVAGSVGVALYDVKEGKKDIDWLPDVVKVFVAVPYEMIAEPLALVFPLMIQWLDEVRGKGFNYRLETEGKSFWDRSISFLFKCQNPSEHGSIRMPRVLFLARCASSVRGMCDRLDLTVSSPVLGFDPENGDLALHTTDRIRKVFKKRRCECRYMVLDKRARACVDKYHDRGFDTVQPFLRGWYYERAEGPYPGGVSYKGADVPRLLGRKPSTREAEEFWQEGSEEGCA